MNLNLQNPALVERLKPFVVAVPENQVRFDLMPFGLPVAARFDPLRVKSRTFLDLIKRLDQVTFGPVGMPMPRWIFVNGAELSGGVVGFGMPRSRVPEETRTLLGVPADYAGIVPYSMFIAIPTHVDGEWIGHNLASINAAVEDHDLERARGGDEGGRSQGVPRGDAARGDAVGPAGPCTCTAGWVRSRY